MSDLLGLYLAATKTDLNAEMGTLVESNPLNAAKVNTDLTASLAGLGQQVARDQSEAVANQKRSLLDIQQKELDSTKATNKTLSEMFAGVAPQSQALIESARQQEQTVIANNQKVAELKRQSQASWNPLVWLVNDFKVSSLEEESTIASDLQLQNLASANTLIDTTIAQANVIKTQESLINNATTRMEASQVVLDTDKKLVETVLASELLNQFTTAKNLVLEAKGTQLTQETSAQNAETAKLNAKTAAAQFDTYMKDKKAKEQAEKVVLTTLASLNGLEFNDTTRGALQVAAANLTPELQASLGALALNYANKGNGKPLKSFLAENLTIAELQKLGMATATGAATDSPLAYFKGVGARQTQVAYANALESFYKSRYDEFKTLQFAKKDGVIDYEQWRKLNQPQLKDEADKYASAVASSEIGSKTLPQMLEQLSAGVTPPNNFNMAAAVSATLVTSDLSKIIKKPRDLEKIKSAFKDSTSSGSLEYRQALNIAQTENFRDNVAKAKAIYNALVKSGVSQSTAVALGAKIFAEAQRAEMAKNPDFKFVSLLSDTVPISLLERMHPETPEVVKNLATPAGFLFAALYTVPKEPSIPSLMRDTLNYLHTDDNKSWGLPD